MAWIIRLDRLPANAGKEADQQKNTNKYDIGPNWFRLSPGQKPAGISRGSSSRRLFLTFFTWRHIKNVNTPRFLSAYHGPNTLGALMQMVVISWALEGHPTLMNHRGNLNYQCYHEESNFPFEIYDSWRNWHSIEPQSKLFFLTTDWVHTLCLCNSELS